MKNRFKKVASSNKEPGEELNAARSPSRKKELVSTVLIFTVAILVALLMKAYLVQPYIVDGQSMATTLHDHDRLLVNKIPNTLARIDGHAYIPKRGNIVIFNQTGLPGYSGQKQLIKRVIALPGERVVIKDGRVTVYNKLNLRGFNPDTLGLYSIEAKSTIGGVDLVLSPNQLFVLGDNRDNSEDSRYFGPISSSQIVGKLSFRIFPISQIQHY